jgi:hypothetical protein
MTTTHRLLTLAALCTLLAACGKDASTGNGAAGQEAIGKQLSIVEIDKIESHLRFLADDARMGRMIGYAIAGDARRPTWNEGDFFGEKFRKR